MENTQKETELLETIRKWENLCDESLADAAHWKDQALELREALWMLKRMVSEGELGQPCLLTLKQAREAIAKVEGAK